MSTTIALTGFSDALSPERLKQLAVLESVLGRNGFNVITGKSLSERTPGKPSPDLKARDMAEILACPDLKFIMDVSGGDTANELLLHPENLAFPNRDIIFTGYSDLTVLLNAFFAAGGSSGVLYQALHAIRERSGERLREFLDFLKKSAYLGNTDAMVYLAANYQEVEKTKEKDKEIKDLMIEAFYWYKEAAGRGNAEAMNRLAPYYEEGKYKFTIGETHSIRLGFNYLFDI